MACASLTIEVDGVTISTNEFENAKELLEISGDGGDPTRDEYEENIAGGNNSTGATGVQLPPPGSAPVVQTTPPGPIDSPPDSVDKSPATVAPSATIPVTSCALWNGDYDFQLSPNFKVRDFSTGALFKWPLVDYPGFTKGQRCCNLVALAVNCAEPLFAKFGPFRINSGIRNATSTSGVSQHIKGQAMDIQFQGWNYARYWENAAWIKDNIPYDQFIYEHSSSTGLVWYHLSFSTTQKRSAVLTMYRNKYSPGLYRFG